MKAILIDDSRRFLARLRKAIALRIPDVEITEYDPEQQGRPGSSFSWSLYNVAFISQELCGCDIGLTWLSEIATRVDVPPIVLISETSDPYLAIDALRRGASDFIVKEDIDGPRLTAILDRLADRSTVVEINQTTTMPDAHRVLSAVPQLAPPDGSSIGYRFVRLIGQGATSRVYLAERVRDEGTLVLKIIDTRRVTEPAILQRFVQEAELVRDLDSPFVVRVYDSGFTPAYGWIAMEFFSRGDLKQRIELGVAPDVALNYLHHIAYGLRAIHRCGIIHRDLKPGNIMFRNDDSLAIADFGISRRLETPLDITRMGSVLGTPNYMSPEQAQGHGITEAVDFYAMGVMLYEMLTGAKPFRADSAAALSYQHVHAPVPKLPPELAWCQALLEQLLAKKPEERIQSADDLIEVIHLLKQRR